MRTIVSSIAHVLVVLQKRPITSGPPNGMEEALLREPPPVVVGTQYEMAILRQAELTVRQPPGC